MATANIVDAQDQDDKDELIVALEASQRGTEATSDKGTEDISDDTKKKDETIDSDGEDKGAKKDGSDGDEKTEGEKAEEAKTAAEAADKAATAADARELRLLLRQQTQRNTVLEAKVGRLEKGQVEIISSATAELDENGEPIKKEVKEVELSSVEVLQSELSGVHQERKESFNLMLEIMEGGKDFADVKEVCSQANFGDIVSVIAEDVAAKEGISETEAFLAVELKIWQQPNPFKYMYNLVKKYHPTYAEVKGDEKDDKSADSDKNKSASDALKKAPGSVAEMGSGGANKAGWTAAKIDALPEDELSKVPKDIYDKYMAQELD